MSTSAPQVDEHKGDGKRRNPLAAIVLFVRQVIAELKKVRTPSGSELASFSVTVLLFVAFMIGLIFGLDFLFGNLATWAFAN